MRGVDAVGHVGQQAVHHGHHLQGAHEGVEAVLAIRPRAEAALHRIPQRRGGVHGRQVLRGPIQRLLRARPAVILAPLAPSGARQAERPLVRRPWVALGQHHAARARERGQAPVHGPHAHVVMHERGCHHLIPRRQRRAPHLLGPHQPEQRSRRRRPAGNRPVAGAQEIIGARQPQARHQVGTGRAARRPGVERPAGGEVRGRGSRIGEPGPPAIAHAREHLPECGDPSRVRPCPGHAQGHIQPRHHACVRGIAQQGHVLRVVPRARRLHMPSPAVVARHHHAAPPRPHAPVGMQDDPGQSSGGYSMTSLKCTMVTWSSSVMSRE